jgi:hypothetical protein
MNVVPIVELDVGKRSQFLQLCVRPNIVEIHEQIRQYKFGRSNGTM